MLFTNDKEIDMYDYLNFPSDVDAMTFEFWLRPLHDVQVSGLQQLLRLSSEDDDLERIRIYFGPDCKCVTVEWNGSSSKRV